jgi:DNA processing protein
MAPTFLTHSAEELLGPFNEVEQKSAPKTIFTAGHIEVLETGGRVSLVGSRTATRDGLARARKLARMLAERSLVVVSGLAKGIDAAAHLGAIEAGGRTIAVIGTPLDKCYPKENADLQARIMREHLCVSQFPIGYPIQPKNFPIRNRTMALISDATVIIEAGESSGSLSQGWEALRLGRGLFIMKSVAENSALKWPKEMLSYGARVLGEETFDEFCHSLSIRSPDLVLSEALI